MYRRPRRDEWYGPSYGHHYPTAHWPISVGFVAPLSSVLFLRSPLCSSVRHPLALGAFRCCVGPRDARPAMPRNFKGLPLGNKPSENPDAEGL